MSGICLPIDAVGGLPQFPAAQNRVADAVLAQGRRDRALGALSGVRPGSDPSITVTTGRVWTVSPFVCIVDPGTGTAVGPFRCAFLANETGQLSPADQNYTRIDRLDVQVPDDPPGASPLAAVLVVTPGVPASNPQLPAAPARSMPLGQFTVPNVGNPSFAATFPYTSAAGGITPQRAGKRPASPYVGQYIDDPSDGLVRWDGTAWTPQTRSKEYWAGTNTNPNLIVGDSTFRATAGWAPVIQSPLMNYLGGGVWRYDGSVDRLVEVNVHMSFLGDGTGQRGIQIRRAGSVVDEYSVPSSPNGASTHLRARYYGTANPGDTFSVFLFVSTASGNQSAEPNANKNQFDIRTV